MPRPQIRLHFSRNLKHALLLPCLFLAERAEATLLLYEGFDSNQYSMTGGYPSSLPPGTATDALIWDPDTTAGNGNHVGQAPPVLGFASSPWDLGSNISSSVYPKLENSQRTYSNGGLSLITTTGQLNIQRTGGSTSNKSFSRGLSLGGGTTSSLPDTLYVSGLITRDATSFNILFSTSNAISNPAEVETRSFRMAVDAAGAVTFTGTGTSASTSDTALWNATSVPTFFVMKIEDSVLNDESPTNGDKITLYLNPDLSSEGANTAAMEFGSSAASYYITGNNSWSMDTITLSANPEPGSGVVFDELRFTTTWEEAFSAVPEPHSALIAVVSAVGFVSLRRRRRDS